jgi:hypothetical protein
VLSVNFDEVALCLSVVGQLTPERLMIDLLTFVHARRLTLLILHRTPDMFTRTARVPLL